MASTPPANTSAPRSAAPGDDEVASHDLNGSSRDHAASEHRAPQRIAHGPDGEVAAPDDLAEESGDGELTAEEIQRETERWAPKTIRDTVAQPSEPAITEKICRVCNKDLKGHRRLKDERGYICLACEKDDRKRRIACAECGKPTLPENLRPWGPISICARCWMDHQADPKARVRRQVSSRPWEEVEKKTTLYMAAAAGVALLVLLLISVAMGC